MLRLALFAFLALASVTGAAHAQTVSTDPRQAPGGAYGVEPRHTQVLFAIAHLGITDYYGRFEKVSGTLSFNSAAPEKSAVSVAIDTGSVNTMSPMLMGELIAADVFDSANFPTATFKSTALTRTGPATGKMTGDLTIRGVTKPVTFDVVFNGGLMNPMGDSYSIGFHATTTIKRSDFGLTQMGWTNFVGDDVKLIVEALFVKQKE